MMTCEDVARITKRCVMYMLENKFPKLVVIQVGEDKASSIYVRNKEKACNECHIDFEHWKFPETVTREEMVQTIEMLNKDSNVNAIIVQLPIPKHLHGIEMLINPNKDVDGLTKDSKFIPCTPLGIIKMLDWNQTSLDGKNCVVIGRSKIVGEPIAKLFLQRNATVTVCHSHTKDLTMYTRNADVIVVAVGKPKLITADMVKDGAIVFDVGINRVNGKLCGDVDYENVKDKCEFITPVPKGLGLMTVACLMQNVMQTVK